MQAVGLYNDERLSHPPYSCMLATFAHVHLRFVGNKMLFVSFVE